MTSFLDCISIAFLIAWLAFLAVAAAVAAAVLAEGARICFTGVRTRWSKDGRFLRKIGIRP